MSRISELLISPIPFEMTTPVHRSSVKVRLDSSSSSRSRIVSPPPAVNDNFCSSDDLRFVSTKSLNLQPATPQTAKSSTLSPPSKSSHLPSGAATIASTGRSRHQQRDPAPLLTSTSKPPHSYQSTDAFVITTPDIAAPPDVISTTLVSSVKTSSRRVDEKGVDEDWQRMVAAASSDQINLVSFHDNINPMSDNQRVRSADAVSYTSSTVPRQSGIRKATSPGAIIFTLEASPPVKGRSAGVTLRSINDSHITTSPEPLTLPSKPLLFANPLYSHSAKVDRSRRNKAAAVTEVKADDPPNAPSNSSGSCPQSNGRHVIGKRPQDLSLAPTSVGVGRSWRHRGDLAGSTESLDSVLASRPASKHRGPIIPSLNSAFLLSQSASHIDRHPPPVMPRTRRPPPGSCDSSPSVTVTNRGIDRKESDFGALKRLWQSIELPMSPCTSTGSTNSYQSPARGTQSRMSQKDRGKHMHSASFDAGLSDLSSSKTSRRGHSCDSLLTGGSTQTQQPNSSQLSVDVQDQSEV